MTESAMVMIPLLITFLSVLQISTGVLDRTVSSNVVQGEVATEAMNDSNSSAAALSNSKGGTLSSSTVSAQQFQLPGGGTFTIGTQSIHKPAVSPLLPGGDNYEATGLAITE
jgi:hypothetical protein